MRWAGDDDVVLDLLGCLRGGEPGSRSFVGQFGLRAEFGINKPSYYDFALLHQLGNQRLANASPNIIVTKTANGDLAIVTWNLVGPESEAQKTAVSRNITIAVHGVPSSASVTVERVDNEHGISCCSECTSTS